MVDVGSLRLARRHVVVATALAIATLVGALGAGFFVQRAASQSAQPTIRACINFYTGNMRILRYGSCNTSSEYMVEWNQQGIQGEQGPQGIQGEQGPPGPPTYLDTYMVSEHHDLSGGGDEGGDDGGGGNDGRSMTQALSGPFMASCEPGDDLLTGGYELIADGDMESAPMIQATRPFTHTPGSGGEDSDGGGEGGEESSEPIESWLVSVEHSGLQGIDVWAICNVDGSGEE